MKRSVMSLVMLVAACLLHGLPLPVEPLLRIETGAHLSRINQLAVDPSGSWAVTASNDKTCRVWELPSGRLHRTLRPPIDAAFEGALIAAAISPDASLVACGGWTAPEELGPVVYVFDRFNGKMVRRLSLPSGTVERLRFSPDGRFLAAGCWNGSVHFARVEDWKWLGPAGKLGGPVIDILFSSDGGRLFAVDRKGGIFAFESGPAGLNPMAAATGMGGSQPRRISLSADGASLAVAYADKAVVDVFGAGDLKHLKAFDASALTGGCSVVAYSPDGRYLYAGKTSLRRWELSAKGRFSDIKIPALGGPLVDAAPMPDGTLVLGTEQPTIGTLTQEGKFVTLSSASAIDQSGNADRGIPLSARGDVLSFRYGSLDKKPSFFAVAERRIDAKGSWKDLTGPVLKSRKYALADGWKLSQSPKLNGIKISLGVKGNDPLYAYAILPGDAGIVLAGNGLTRLDERAAVVWKVYSSSNYPVVAINASKDGRFVVGAYMDGTIKWHRASDGKELVCLFAHPDRKRWAAWSPSGYYDCSPGGDELVGWHQNNGAEREADFFPSSRVRGSRYRPDVIAALFSTLDEAEAVRKANQDSGRSDPESRPLAELFPPVVTILSPREGSGTDKAELVVSYELRSPAGSPVDSVWAAIDGRPLESSRGLKVVAVPGAAQVLTLTVPPRDCEVSLIAENRNAASVPASLRIKWSGAPPAPPAKPALVALCVGVSAYKDPALRLGLAAKDAADLSAVLKAQEGRQYSRVTIRQLGDASATKDAILAGLEWLRTDTGTADIALLFLAGHGVSDSRGRFYYLAVDTEPSRLVDTAISYDDLRTTIASIEGKAVFLVDACYSGSLMGARGGQADVVALANGLASAENGAVVFMSSTGKQVSLEDPRWGNGAFTKALVEGLAGKADYSGSGRITVTMLDLYVSERVTELTDGRQTPATSKPFTVADFTIARRN
ncbi:MAG: caspase family protein [Spirochaetes bacterium]|nr:caspase family protein [Spirochaetota bacterium]